MFKSFVRKIITDRSYTRVVKALIRNAIIHEKSEKFRRDVVNAIQSFEFESNELSDVIAFDSLEGLLKETITRVNPNLSEWIELGVMTGNSARQIAAFATKQNLTMTLHGFDSFEGLPEDWHARAKQGAFAIRQPSFSEPNIKVHVGLFDTTLPIFAAELESQLGFIHVDSDLYSSAKTAFDILGAYIKPGTVILFDEYWNYPEFRDHEIKAFEEFITANNLDFEYIGYYKDHMQLSIIIK